MPSGSRTDSHTIVGTSSEVIISGPGRLFVGGNFHEPEFQLSANLPDAEVRLRMMAAGDDHVMEIVAHLRPIAPSLNPDGFAKNWEWTFSGAPSGARR